MMDDSNQFVKQIRTKWCAQRESNPHESLHYGLNVARLPLRHVRMKECWSVALRHTDCVVPFRGMRPAMEIGADN
jgi:hypothetical protein